MAALYPDAKVKGLTYEEETTFGTDPDGSKTRLWVGGIKAALDQDMLPDIVQQSAGAIGDRHHIRAGEKGSLTFEQPIYTIGGSEAPFIALAKRCGMTHVAIAAAAGKVTGGAETTIVCATADKGNLAVGAGVMHIPVIGTASMRFCTREQADTPAPGSTTFTVHKAFTTTPVNGDGWGATDTLMPTTGVQAKSFAFCEYEGYGSHAVKKALAGCAGKWKIAKAEAGGILTASWEFMIDNWAISEAALAMAAKTGSDPLTILGATVQLDDTAFAIRSLEFDPGLALQWEASQAGTHGRAGAFYGTPTPSLSFSPLMDVDWWTKMSAATGHEFWWDRTLTSTNGCGLWVPEFEVVGMGEEDDGQLLRAAPKLHITDAGRNADGTQLPMYAIAMTH